MPIGIGALCDQLPCDEFDCDWRAGFCEGVEQLAVTKNASKRQGAAIIDKCFMLAS
jgi:hypothetical protein